MELLRSKSFALQVWGQADRPRHLAYQHDGRDGLGDKVWHHLAGKPVNRLYLLAFLTAEAFQRVYGQELAGKPYVSLKSPWYLFKALQERAPTLVLEPMSSAQAAKVCSRFLPPPLLPSHHRPFSSTDVPTLTLSPDPSPAPSFYLLPSPKPFPLHPS